jgi:hypothetical protein
MPAVKREQRGFALGLAVALSSVFFQVAGLAVHLAFVNDLGRHCPSADCAAPGAGPGHGALPGGARLAVAESAQSPLECLICQALQQMRPEADVLALPDAAFTQSTAPVVLVAAADPRPGSPDRSRSPRGPPSFLS